MAFCSRGGKSDLMCLMALSAFGYEVWMYMSKLVNECIYLRAQVHLVEKTGMIYHVSWMCGVSIVNQTAWNICGIISGVFIMEHYYGCAWLLPMSAQWCYPIMFCNEMFPFLWVPICQASEQAAGSRPRTGPHNHKHLYLDRDSYRILSICLKI